MFEPNSGHHPILAVLVLFILLRSCVSYHFFFRFIAIFGWFIRFRHASTAIIVARCVLVDRYGCSQQCLFLSINGRLNVMSGLNFILNAGEDTFMEFDVDVPDVISKVRKEVA